MSEKEIKPSFDKERIGRCNEECPYHRGHKIAEWECDHPDAIGVLRPTRLPDVVDRYAVAPQDNPSICWPWVFRLLGGIQSIIDREAFALRSWQKERER